MTNLQINKNRFFNLLFKLYSEIIYTIKFIFEKYNNLHTNIRNILNFLHEMTLYFLFRNIQASQRDPHT